MGKALYDLIIRYEIVTQKTDANERDVESELRSVKFMNRIFQECIFTDEIAI